MFTPVILAGGNGSRLWPLSRQSFPKQFLALDGQDQGTMFQRTLARLQGLEHSPAIIVSNEQHRFIVAEQLRVAKMTSRRIILEPLARNTAPAIALAALEATANGSDPILLVLAADHFIHDEKAFRDAVSKAQVYAEKGHLVTFGITPTHAETGFGYIQCGAPIDQGGFAIAAFKEKPSLEVAEEYLSSGAYLWNSGMFMFRASVFLAELKKHRPDILATCHVALEHAEADSHFLHVQSEHFVMCADESVDYAVMEHTDTGLVVPLDAGWNDLGSWAAIWDVGPHDADKNRIEGDVMAIDTRNCLVQSHHRLVATVGLDDLIVIETKDAVLVANKNDSQQVKDVVKRLLVEERAEFVTHPLVNRPWGHYDTVDKGERYQVKRISVLPGECLSLQLHYHRAEHWIVVSGTARVICGDNELILSENQSTYIPLGVKHSLSNPGKVPLELIEVQSGVYLGEDDIVRFEDRYGRLAK
ncbi:MULTISPECIES: mannose-1-phosphate guanylyltransferase/mannose-6-phosphate isomerase [Pseudomonas]|uniref:Alginate biosynthesis protein AlgA n=1 Tax=Pseudomonas helleri TaxID=1608996 RepID=A0A6L5I367_9PSED|nr:MULTISPECIES: mannose-1-phosphate guanylyltransferase/mannose-6-phosphate isomerase [Pseudomonas]MQU09131.1 mannose-1-phosphate guanylyltransferase/mannose-6-phosphate isomerase [Pseudomonas helleri]NNA19064.1 mannose-1-phosphate guanylyltransferase/mannose-6-phosphate isomerase [Pseudomonas lundensis]OZY44335.1 mannose-1-phosphate guanylyltransferase/mannose-6-phosphate isomerase [Pseudomonas lundensis]